MKEIIAGFLLVITITTAKIENKLIDLEVSAYCSCQICSEGWGASSASGEKLKSGLVAAPQELSFGTELIIEGKKYRVADRGGYIKKVNGVYRIDIYMENHEEALKYGRREVKGFIKKEGKK